MKTRCLQIAILVSAVFCSVIFWASRNDTIVLADGMTEVKLSLNQEYTPPNCVATITLREIAPNLERCRFEYRNSTGTEDVWLAVGNYDTSGWWGTEGLHLDAAAKDSVIVTIRYAITDFRKFLRTNSLKDMSN